MPDATVAASPAAGFTRADLTTFCRLDESGLKVDPTTTSAHCRRRRPHRRSSSRSTTPSPRAPRCAPAASASRGREATVLTDVTPQMRAFREEIFGPDVVIYRVADADEAIELANSSTLVRGFQARNTGRS
jgi:hypothetical protein